MSDQPTRAEVIRAVHALAAKYPDGAIYCFVVPDHRHAETIGLTSTSDLAIGFEAMCTDMLDHHAFGNCDHCDRLAMAMQAARKAFRDAFGGPDLSCEVKQ